MCLPELKLKRCKLTKLKMNKIFYKDKNLKKRYKFTEIKNEFIETKIKKNYQLIWKKIFVFLFVSIHLIFQNFSTIKSAIYLKNKYQILHLGHKFVTNFE